MAVAYDPGVAVEAVVAILTANLTAQLATVQASTAYASDGVTLTAIKTYYRGMPGIPDLFPCISVSPSGGQHIEDQYAHFNLRGHNLDLIHWQMAFEGHTTYGVVGRMQKCLERTERAIEEVLQANRGLSATGLNKCSVASIGPPSWQPFDTIAEGDQSRVVRSVRLPLGIAVK